MRTQEQFSRFAKKELELILFLLEEKGGQYSNGRGDALENFNVGADLLGTSPETYLMTLATKQWYVLTKYAAAPEQHDPEVIRGRIHDVIIYLLLLLFMDFYTEDKEVQNESLPSGTHR